MRAAIFSSLVILAVLSVGQARTVVNSPLTREDITNMMLIDVCEECNKIKQMLMDMDSRSTIELELLRKSLYGVCLQLPKGDALTRCYMLVAQHLPTIMDHQSDMCVLMELCPPVQPIDEDPDPKYLLNAIAMAAASTTPLPDQKSGPVCVTCLFLMKKMEAMLPKDKTEEDVLMAMDKACGMLPEKYLDQCNDFLEKHGKQVAEFLLSDAAPHTICMMLDLCFIEDAPPNEYGLTSDCTACLTLSALTRFRHGQNATETQIASLLQTVCRRHPNAVPQCQVFTRIYGPKLLRILGKQDGGQDACEKEDFCQNQWWRSIY